MMRRILLFYICLLIIVLFTYCANAYEINHNCDKHPIYCQIITNKPIIKRAYAFKLSNVIYNISRKYRLDPEILTAILAQESMYNIASKNCTTGLHKQAPMKALIQCMETEELGTEQFAECVGKAEYIKARVCTDFGIGQIWYKTVNRYDFDIQKLTSDINYSVEASAIVLKYFKNTYSKKESDWWTRYNASNKKARKKYKELVKRFTNAN